MRCLYCQVTAQLNSAQTKSCTWLLHQSKRTKYYNNPREGERGGSRASNTEETATGKWGQDPRCCLDNKRRICARNKEGEVEDSGATLPEQHPALSRLGFTRATCMAACRFKTCERNCKLVGGASRKQKGSEIRLSPGGAFGFAVISIEGLQIKHNIIYSLKPPCDTLILELFAN